MKEMKRKVYKQLLLYYNKCNKKITNVTKI